MSELVDKLANALEKGIAVLEPSHVGWLQGCLAKDHIARVVHPEKETACHFCILGATAHGGIQVVDLVELSAFIRDYEAPLAKKLEATLFPVLVGDYSGNARSPWNFIANFNDQHCRDKKQALSAMRAMLAVIKEYQS